MEEENNLPAVSDNADLRARAGAVQIHGGAMVPKNLAEVMEFGQLMAKAGPMVGKAFRGNPGACVAITMQAMQWGMSPFAVSQKAYVTNESIAYEAQLVTAVINAHAPVVERPQYEYIGAGAKRQCIITATLKGDTKPSIYTSPEVGAITTKNSPLWKTDIDQQLGYYSIRAWARKYCPEIIMGVYTVDEMQGVERVAVSGSEAIDDYDQRRPEEIAEESTGAFIMGEAWTFVREHYTKLFAECADVEAANKQWASFQRKYWVGKRKVISNLSYQGMEIEYDNAKARLTKGESLWPWVQSAIAGFDDLSDLEQWWADADTTRKIALLLEARQTEATALYEAKAEELADAAHAALLAKRQAAGEVVAK